MEVRRDLKGHCQSIFRSGLPKNNWFTPPIQSSRAVINSQFKVYLRNQLRAKAATDLRGQSHAIENFAALVLECCRLQKLLIFELLAHLEFKSQTSPEIAYQALIKRG